MNIFTPSFFSIANIASENPEQILTPLREEFTKQFGAADSSYNLGFDAHAFVNKHPDVTDVIIEIQAGTDESRSKGIEIANTIANEACGLTLTWIDVTREALELRAKSASEKSE